eukprot:5189299-Prorocentrum_lima.AAC.1
MPAADYSRLSLASYVQTLPSKIPATKAGLAKWFGRLSFKIGNGIEAWCSAGANNDHDDADQRC